MDDFMEGNECQVSYEVMQSAWLRFWNKNQLAINSDGKVYRTKTPRQMPDRIDDFRNHAKSNKTMHP